LGNIKIIYIGMGSFGRVADIWTSVFGWKYEQWGFVLDTWFRLQWSWGRGMLLCDEIKWENQLASNK
jgi:hypothetical protein